MSKVIEINNLSKVYDLGLVGTGTLSKDLNRMWAKLRGKPDPYATIVEINDRTKKSSSNMVYALKDINFSVNQGEVLGIIGKNSAGKSTLLKILSQITSPSSGTIKMKGRVASLLEVGTGMHPEMTARQNIYLNGSLMGMRRHEITSKLDEIVDFGGIKKYVDTPVKRFSSGMKVRLGFAIAAFLEPEILIVDEVLAVGDAEFQQKCIGKMKDVAGEGRTVLFVSHNMASISALCSKVILIDNGKVVASGAPEEMITKYVDYCLGSAMQKTLPERDDRVGNQLIKFVDVKSYSKLDTSEISEDVVVSGKKTFFDFHFTAKSDEINSFLIGIIIYDSMGTALFNCNTKFFSKMFEINEDKGYVRCSINKLPLMPGYYRIKIYSKANGDWSDQIENAAEFSVVEGNFYESGKLPKTTKSGTFLVDHEWEVGYE
jgi:lipopolysaccharide transport system ATP-binding protein